MNSTAPPRDIEAITEGAKAAVLVQHPLRRRILARARRPISATELAAELGLTRQGVNYHVRQLAKAGYLKPAGKRLRRNLIERQYIATAHSYVLSPELLGPVAAVAQEGADVFSAAYLLGLTSLAQQELSAVTDAAAQAGVRVLTLSMTSAVRFQDAAQRAAFGKALSEAVADVVARHTSPNQTPEGEPGVGRPYRLVVGCYPIPENRGQS